MTALAVMVLPISTPVVLASGVIATLLTHAALTAAHESFDAIEETYG